MGVRRYSVDTAEEVMGWLTKPDCDTSSWPSNWRTWGATKEAHRMLAARFINELPSAPDQLWAGDGIVIIGGGVYFDSAYVSIRMIRRVGCSLPIQLWHRRGEVTPKQAKLLEPYGVELVDGDEIREEHPRRQWGGWQLKPFAVYFSRFSRVLMLDADCYPVTDPSPLFDELKKTGAIFFPDGTPQHLPDRTWEVFGMSYRDEPSFEAGQLLVDKDRCFKELLLTIHFNDHSDYYYKWDSHTDPERILYGDKDTFHMAWRLLGTEYQMFSRTPLVTDEAYLHTGPDGGVWFVHRCKAKFSRERAAFPTAQVALKKLPNLPQEDEAWEFFEDLKRKSPRYRNLKMVVPAPIEGIEVVKVGGQLADGRCFNPTILKNNEVLVYRRGHYGARIGVAPLTEDFQPEKADLLPQWSPHSVEDPRAFYHDGSPWLSYTDYDGTIASVGIVRLTEDLSGIREHRTLHVEGRQHWEKNWVFFEWQTELFCVYSTSPHQILHIPRGSSVAHRVWRTACPTCSYGEPRGGASPVRLGNEFYHFFHSVESREGVRIYGLGVYTFSASPPFEVRRFGSRPLLVSDPSEAGPGEVPAVFPGGAVLLDKEWIISCGWNDRECRIIRVPVESVEEALR